MAWNPEELECRSYWGYGSGWFVREDQARAKEHNYEQTPETQMFCNRCPISAACWTELQERVRRERPEAAAAWDRLVEQHKVDGTDTGRIATALLRAGRPDPWMKDLLANMKNGSESRYTD